MVKGRSVDSKISFRAVARKRWISCSRCEVFTHVRKCSVLHLLTCVWKISRRVLRGKCVRVPMDPHWPPTGGHSTKTIFYIHVTFDLWWVILYLTVNSWLLVLSHINTNQNKSFIVSLFIYLLICNFIHTPFEMNKRSHFLSWICYFVYLYHKTITSKRVWHWKKNNRMIASSMVLSRGPGATSLEALRTSPVWAWSM